MCDPSHTVLSMRRPTNVTSWASAQMCQFPPTSAPQVRAERLVQDVQLPGGADPTSFLPTEFSVLVDLSSEESCQDSPVGSDDVSSRYQFTISSANAQPADRGEKRSHRDFVLFKSRLDFIYRIKREQNKFQHPPRKSCFGARAFVMNLNYLHFHINA